MNATFFFFFFPFKRFTTRLKETHFLEILLDQNCLPSFQLLGNDQDNYYNFDLLFVCRSDVLGQFMPLVGRDWTQSGVARLFSAIKVCFHFTYPLALQRLFPS